MGKDIENRPQRYTVIRHRWIALHAGQRIGGGSLSRGDALSAVEAVAARAGWERFGLGLRHPDHGFVPLNPDAIDTEAICAVAYLADIIDGDRSPWAMDDQWHWKLERVTFLREPVPAKGAQGIWRTTKAQQRAIADQLQGEITRRPAGHYEVR